MEKERALPGPRVTTALLTTTIEASVRAKDEEIQSSLEEEGSKKKHNTWCGEDIMVGFELLAYFNYLKKLSCLIDSSAVGTSFKLLSFVV